MLGVFFVYFIGKKFYDLAGKYDQGQWLFAILSVVLYFASGIVVGVVLVLSDVFLFHWNVDWENNAFINFLGLPVGLLAVWGFYMFLESRWKRNVLVVKDGIQDIGKITED